MKHIRVIVFDDNRDRRDSLEMLLSLDSRMICAGTFENCQHLDDHIAGTCPDVVLMDIDMPGMNGIDAVKKIRASHPHIRIIMQTVFEDEARISAAISAGADGYILKKASPEKLLEAIGDVMEGGAPMTPSVARFVLTVFQGRNATASPASEMLSPREKEVLTHLVNGLSYKMIAAECGISVFTVNAHIRKIYDKMQVHSVAEAVAKALRDGVV
jgi:DNA-binding NarL/FixJ family response regulator